MYMTGFASSPVTLDPSREATRAEPAPRAGSMDIAMGVNRSYLPFAATVMRSCLDHHDGSRLRFHLLHPGDLVRADVERLGRMVAADGGWLSDHPLPRAVVDALPASKSFPPVVSMRLLLPHLVSDIGRVLYLDADVVVQAPLDDLWTADLYGMPLGAVHNIVEPRYGPHIEALGLDLGRFFNSGVLVMDLEKIRSAGLVESMLELGARRRDELLWPDQEILNLGFSDAWTPLHPRWNVQNSFYAFRALTERVIPAELVAEAVADPGVRHFEGPWLCKPWHYLCSEPSVELFRDALARTPWQDETAWVERTIVTRAIHCLPRRRWLPAYLQWLQTRERARRLRGRVAGLLAR